MSLQNKKIPCSDQCKSLLTVQTINFVFRQHDTSNKELIASCFYSCWYYSFVSSAKIIYSSYSANYIHEIADISFTDALLAFMQKAATDGFYQSTATAKSIAFTFFKNKLHESIRKDKTKLMLNNEDIDEFKYGSGIPDEDHGNAMLACLEKIKPMLPPEDIDICNWKFSHKLSNSEIAQKLSITTNSFTNRFYRLTGRMEKLIKDCLQSSGS